MTTRPNILFIIADDHRQDAIRATGDPTVQTPVLDSLVADGVTFRRAHIMGGMSGAVCVPCRACINTGVTTFRAAASREVQGRGLLTINPDLALMGETFRQAGYQTFATGKWHNDRASFARSFASGANIFFGGMSDHLQVPVHDFDPQGIYPDEAKYIGKKFSTELFADSAIQFLEDHDGNEPFFLYLSFTAPHDPRTAPKDYASLYNPEAMPVPQNFLAEHPFDNGDMRLRDEQLAPWPRTPEVAQEHIADYYAMITHMDTHIGRILDTLETQGYGDNTIVVYTADHGLAVGQHGLLGKQNMYDHSIRVPSIIKGPGIPANHAVDTVTYSFDMFPTLCELTGLPIPDTVESQSLVPLINGQAKQQRQTVFSVYKDIQRMVSDGEWKFIRYYRSLLDQMGEDRIQLFHLSEDPWETEDLADDPTQQARIQQFAAEMAVWQDHVDDILAGQPVLPTA